jgi:hypothetical protein
LASGWAVSSNANWSESTGVNKPAGVIQVKRLASTMATVMVLNKVFGRRTLSVRGDGREVCCIGFFNIIVLKPF